MSPPSRPNAELVDARGRKYLTAAERTRFFAAVRAHPKPTTQTLARTLAMTGCRVSESLGLRVCDVDLEAAELRIATLKRRREHWRAVPIPEDLHTRRSTWYTAYDLARRLHGDVRDLCGTSPARARTGR